MVRFACLHHLCGSILLVVAALTLLGGCAATPLEQFPRVPDESIPNSQSSLVKPDGAGPFPAVVMLHTCGGVGRHLKPWIARLAGEGYVVLMVDSFTPRGAGNVCGNFSVSVDQVSADALAGAAHLRKLPFVDPARVSVVGFSYGASAALRVTSTAYLARQLHQVPFHAAVAFYPFCTVVNFGTRFEANQDNLRTDVGTPTLMLLGGRDDETPAHLCTTRGDDLARRGQPVRYVVYPEATHAFDQNIPSKGYRYDANAVEASWRELKAFLAGSHPARGLP